MIVESSRLVCVSKQARAQIQTQAAARVHALFKPLQGEYVRIIQDHSITNYRIYGLIFMSNIDSKIFILQLSYCKSTVCHC